MKAFTFNINTAEVKKRFTKKDFFVHTPSNESRWKAYPYIEINLEDTPKKNQVTSIRISFKELKKLMTKK